MTEDSQAPISIEALNAMTREEFTRRLGGILEHSPHFAERAWEARPYGCQGCVESAFDAAVAAASEAEKLALLQAHPDLADRMVRLTNASTQEQSAARLDALTPEELAEFQRLNAAYREKFGFPFIICARLNSKDAILAAFRTRLENAREKEFETALGEVAKIARLRLTDLLKD